MRVTIVASGGISRQLHLASRFDASGELERLFIPFYSGKHPLLARRVRGREDPQVVDPSRVSTDLGVALYRKLLMRTPTARLLGIDADVAWRRALSRRAARRLTQGADVVMAESMVALEALARARQLGIATVLDRTNSHILTQQELVGREYEEHGLPQREWHSPKMVQRGLGEYELADHIVALSSFARDTFIDRGFAPERVSAVPPGVDLTGFAPAPRTDDIFRIIYVGTLCLKKGTHHLLEAFSKAALPGAELLLIGSIAGEIRPWLERHEGTFVHSEYVPHSQLASNLTRGSIFVLPSVEDGFGKVILEAMACGLPVIASTNTGGPDVVREGVDGYIVPIRDPETMADRFTRLASDRALLARMGEAARQRVADGFTWERYAARMREALARVAAGVKAAKA